MDRGRRVGKKELHMERREFLASACVAGVTAVSASGAIAAGNASDGNGFFEIRKITVGNEQKLDKLLAYLRSELMPDFRENEIKPVGLAVDDPVLNKTTGQARSVYLFIPYRSMNESGGLGVQAGREEAYRALIERCSSKDAPYDSLERSLLYYFPSCPRLEVPNRSEQRVFQMRLYRSCEERRNRLKQHMFEEGGELAIFRQCGMNPVFFGVPLFGTFLPNLTYMLSFESDEHRKEAWAKFVRHPDWQKLKEDPMYADTATEIINIFLRPCEGSEI